MGNRDSKANQEKTVPTNEYDCESFVLNGLIFSYLAYQCSEKDAQNKLMLSLNDENIQKVLNNSSWKLKDCMEHAALFENQQTKEIYLACRGSQSSHFFSDWIVKNMGGSLGLSDGRISCIDQRYRSQIIEYYQQGYSIYFTGDSAGGDTATCLLSLVVKDLGSDSLTSQRLHAIVSSAPNLINKHNTYDVQPLYNNKLIYSICHQDDIVSSLNFAKIQDRQYIVLDYELTTTKQYLRDLERMKQHIPFTTQTSGIIHLRAWIGITLEAHSLAKLIHAVTKDQFHCYNEHGSLKYASIYDLSTLYQSHEPMEHDTMKQICFALEREGTNGLSRLLEQINWELGAKDILTKIQFEAKEDNINNTHNNMTSNIVEPSSTDFQENDTTLQDKENPIHEDNQEEKNNLHEKSVVSSKLSSKQTTDNQEKIQKKRKIENELSDELSPEETTNLELQQQQERIRKHIEKIPSWQLHLAEALGQNQGIQRIAQAINEQDFEPIKLLGLQESMNEILRQQNSLFRVGLWSESSGSYSIDLQNGMKYTTIHHNKDIMFSLGVFGLIIPHLVGIPMDLSFAISLYGTHHEKKLIQNQQNESFFYEILNIGNELQYCSDILSSFLPKNNEIIVNNTHSKLIETTKENYGLGIFGSMIETKEYDLIQRNELKVIKQTLPSIHMIDEWPFFGLQGSIEYEIIHSDIKTQTSHEKKISNHALDSYHIQDNNKSQKHSQNILEEKLQTSVIKETKEYFVPLTSYLWTAKTMSDYKYIDSKGNQQVGLATMSQPWSSTNLRTLSANNNKEMTHETISPYKITINNLNSQHMVDKQSRTTTWDTLEDHGFHISDKNTNQHKYSQGTKVHTDHTLIKRASSELHIEDISIISYNQQGTNQTQLLQRKTQINSQNVFVDSVQITEIPKDQEGNLLHDQSIYKPETNTLSKVSMKGVASLISSNIHLLMKVYRGDGITYEELFETIGSSIQSLGEGQLTKIIDLTFNERFEQTGNNNGELATTGILCTLYAGISAMKTYNRTWRRGFVESISLSSDVNDLSLSSSGIIQPKYEYFIKVINPINGKLEGFTVKNQDIDNIKINENFFPKDQVMCYIPSLINPEIYSWERGIINRLCSALDITTRYYEVTLHCQGRKGEIIKLAHKFIKHNWITKEQATFISQLSQSIIQKHPLIAMPKYDIHDRILYWTPNSSMDMTVYSGLDVISGILQTTIGTLIKSGFGGTIGITALQVIIPGLKLCWQVYRQEISWNDAQIELKKLSTNLVITTIGGLGLTQGFMFALSNFFGVTSLSPLLSIISGVVLFQIGSTMSLSAYKYGKSLYKRQTIYFELLREYGLSPQATGEDITKAFHFKRLYIHPNRSQSPWFTGGRIISFVNKSWYYGSSSYSYVVSLAKGRDIWYEIPHERIRFNENNINHKNNPYPINSIVEVLFQPNHESFLQFNDKIHQQELLQLHAMYTKPTIYNQGKYSMFAYAIAYVHQLLDISINVEKRRTFDNEDEDPLLLLQQHNQNIQIFLEKDNPQIDLALSSLADYYDIPKID